MLKEPKGMRFEKFIQYVDGKRMLRKFILDYQWEHAINITIRCTSLSYNYELPFGKVMIDLDLPSHNDITDLLCPINNSAMKKELGLSILRSKLDNILNVTSNEKKK